ncbi:outer membrane lipoprotein carrier protein LolA [Microbacterium sp. B2969]|uniref:Outer membrane lipoprotein carrier protein LolA n=1 Tax=Microbacterium alkaliflavum TaxID=3248839 RepID=A0ABW7QC11_9MICO
MGTRQATRSPVRRLSIAGAAVVVAVVAAALVVPTVATARVDLPDKTPAELVQFAAASHVSRMTGTIEQSSDLGLPDLSSLTAGSSAGKDSSADALDLVTGSHTAKVYLDGDRARLQVLDRLAERDVYVDHAAKQGWFVDSETKTATHYTATGGDAGSPVPQPTATPQQMLDDALAKLGESTDISVGTDGRVAGRDAYELVLVPKDAESLVGEVRFAIDGATGAALDASVTARGADQPAFEVVFTQVAFSAPDAATLAYTPAPGFTVEEKTLPSHSEHGATPEAGADAAQRPVVHGEGWTAVVELPQSDAKAGAAGEDAAMIEKLTRPVAGGRVLETALVTVFFADDGRVFAGAVGADRLAQVAAGG